MKFSFLSALALVASLSGSVMATPVASPQGVAVRDVGLSTDLSADDHSFPTLDKRGDYICQYDNQKFPNTREGIKAYQKHMETAHGQNPKYGTFVECPIDGTRFPDNDPGKAGLAAHMKAKHGK
ncbi:hypothetical protein PspLS_07080 [Pyricularia sp. CBS 133598]|nr:hypothetical protein PspLS_07080 [Pyricularia sp. CBS 133598]